MRIGSTVLLHEQTCVQSYGWELFRPLGSLQGVMDSLEEYQCDEVAIIRPVRAEDTFESFVRDLSVLKSLKTMTPVSFGGGIRSAEHLQHLTDLPIERLVFSTAFLDGNEDLLNAAKNSFGHQAIQCLLPLKRIDNRVCVYHSGLSRSISLDDIDTAFINSFANEIILVDTENEGSQNTFDWSLLNDIPFDRNKIVISGGIGKICVKQAQENNLASVLIDNKVLHKEYSISGFKHAAVLS
ncbi:HisA/HisF-related TIM barrel protein [Vibrio gallaecicus]|uniref:HisA/HisF-related TIM barrel protein n=1 Tax=Vibrio gallaecicus TaxID=552386 RepID=A0ABV4NA38_9VIBR